MSFGGGSIGPPPSFMVIFAGTLCIVLSMPLSMVLGIPETTPILLGVIIMLIGAPITLHTDRNKFGAMPPCFLFGFTGCIILFGGFMLSFPFGGNPLGAGLVILGICQAVIGGALGTFYNRKGRSQSESPMLEGLARMQRTMRSFSDAESTSSTERVIEREVLLRQRVPLECSNCGAPINQEEIDWIGPETIRCLSCGHSLRVETERF